MKIRNWKKNIFLFGFIVAMAILTACLLVGALVLADKRKVSATPMDLSEKQESFTQSTEVTEKLQLEMEKEIQTIVTEYLQNKGVEVDDDMRKELKKAVEEMELHMLQEFVTAREELQKIITKELETEWQAYIEKQKQPDVQPQITETKEELGSLKEIVNTVKLAFEAMQIQFEQMQKGVGNCVVRYNTEDGHFYSIYNEGTEEEVSKKLDFAQ